MPRAVGGPYSFAVIRARAKQGERKRQAAAERRAEMLRVTEAPPTKTIRELAAAFGVSGGWFWTCVHRARNERSQRRLKERRDG